MYLVSDFDGVWTNPIPEASAIRQLMIQRLAQAANLSEARVADTFALIEQEFVNNPFQYGWMFEGQITAFAAEDMYGRNHAVAHALWVGIPSVADGEILQAAIAQVAGDADRLANSCFGDARAQYRETTKAFLVPAAAQVVATLRAQGHRVTIVSNSKTDHIVDLFEAAQIDMTDIEILGGARKFHLGETPSLPKTYLWGEANVSLQRPYYLEILERLQPDAVIGDVFSLDLALPLYLAQEGSRPAWHKFRAGLIQQPYTPQWASVQSGVTLLSGLSEVPTWLEQGAH